MKTIAKTFSCAAGSCPDGAVFLDIETTGFSAGNQSVYLIGCCHRRGDSLEFLQWFAETPGEEGEIIRRAAAFLSPFGRLITFNGENFDLPFLKKRAEILGLPAVSFSGESLDLFRQIQPLKALLGLSDCRQKTLETFLGLSREDSFSGGDLVHVYREYVHHPSEEALRLLLLHNEEDVLAMPDLLPLLTYVELFKGHFSVEEILGTEKAESALPAGDGDKPRPGDAPEETPFFSITLRLSLSVPRPLFLAPEGFRLYVKGNVARMSISVFSGELKHYFPDYRNYYYLPGEDTALHKSVAAYVEKEHRMPATPDTAYQKKSGEFLRIPRFFTPLHVFRAERHGIAYMLLQDFPDSADFYKDYLRGLVQEGTAELSRS